jgi:hypothetical protein
MNRKDIIMRIVRIMTQRSRTARLAGTVLGLLLAGSTALLADGVTPLHPRKGVTMELIGQALVLSPQAAIQYGYLSHVAGLETIFTGTPQNETNAVFTFYNDTATKRVIVNGPLRIVNREGTATFYLNSTPSGDFSNPDSFRAGVPVMTANLRHQVIQDTVENSFITQFDLTVTSTEPFTADGREHVLGRLGQKLTWIVYGRPNTSSPGFAIAGFVLSE